MNTLSNVKSIRAVHQHFACCSTSLSFVPRRTFAGPAPSRPADGKYSNVFNRRKSRCGRFTYYSVFPIDVNEPWPFPPVYDKHGLDLNQDPMWGRYGQAPPSSITGKPKRALGHYPWLGRPIVPMDDHYRYIYDDQVSPFPFFRSGDYRHNRLFWWGWFWFYFWFLGSFWFMDHYWRQNVSMTWYRDKLFFHSQLANDKVWSCPLGAQQYSNPASPITKYRANKDRWVLHNKFLSYRYESLYIPGAKEDMYPEHFMTIDFKHWPKQKKQQEAAH